MSTLRSYLKLANLFLNQKMVFYLLPISTIAKHFNRTSPNLQHYGFRSRINQLSVVPIVLLSECAKKSIQIQENVLWDDIPAEIRSSESLKGFKNQYKKFLIEKL